HSTCLETLRWVLRLVFNEELAQAQLFPEPFGWEQWCPAFAERNDVFVLLDRKHFAIPPKIGASTTQRFFCQSPTRLLQVVTNQKRLAAFATEIVQPMCLVASGAGGAFQVGNVHDSVGLRVYVIRLADEGRILRRLASD